MAKRKQPNLTQYQIKTEPPYRFLTEVPRFEWRQPWSTPPTKMGPTSRQAGVANIAAGMFAPVFTPPVVMGWLTPLSEPVRSKRSLHPSLHDVSADVYQATTPEVVTVDKWFDGLDVPTRAKQRAIADYAFAPLATSEVVTIDKWFNPLAPPLYAKRGLLASAQQTLSTFVKIPPPVRGAGPYVLQTNAIDLIILQSGTGFLLLQGQPLLEDSWHQGWSDPVRVKPQLATASQQALAFVKAAPFPETVTESRWHQPWSEPLRPKQGLRAASQQAYFSPISVTAAAETITVDKWYRPLVDPTRRKIIPKVNLFPTVAASEPVTESRWHQPLSEPLRSKPRLRAAGQAAFFAPSTVITGETITVDKWFAPFQNPSRPKTSVSVASQQVASLVVTAVEIVTVDKWFEQLSDPIRRKPGERDRYKGENDFTAIAANMKWFAPLTDPVRQKIGLATNQQLTLAFVVTIASTEVITVDKWFESLVDPVRVKPALLTGRQQFLTWPTQIIIPSLASFVSQLSDPPKAKAGLLTANQRFETRTADFIPHPDRFLEGWFNWWSEPVRTKPGLSVRLQSSWTGPHRVLATIIDLTMSATETGVDTAMFAIKVFNFNPAVTAVVSLVEIGHGASLTSIVEDGDDGSGTSIVET